MNLFAPILSQLRDRLDAAATGGSQQEVGKLLLDLYAPVSDRFVRTERDGYGLANQLGLMVQENGSQDAFVEWVVLLHGMKTQDVLTTPLQKAIEQADKVVFETVRRQIRLDALTFADGEAAALNYFMLHPETVDYARQLVQLIARHTEPERLLYALDGQAQQAAKHNGLTKLLIALVSAGQRGLASPSLLKWIESAVKYRLHYLTLMVNSTESQSEFRQSASGPFEQEALATNEPMWTRGDLNEVVLLYQVATLLSDSYYRQLADRIGLDTIMHREVAQTVIRHAEFRQGAAGIAHTYDYLFRLTGYMAYRNGWHYWLTRTIDLLRTDLASNYYAHREWHLLNGIVGVYLMLHATVTHTRQVWSDIILL
ncbi:glycoside hydrolase family protein [Spirosoma validum]|uniref:Uncharacterized protein n=1 Tax=Spirosoma validum TaxID=2771355 RepID=A0A927GDR5_9BACT|nr:hypothetical protein [Spirosoma validum]MBD2754072.1 hypothetical protein [Spirosoma validum]